MVRPMRRHLLVIASQCDQMDRLETLEEAATALDLALRHHGECEAALPDRSLLYGDLLGAEIDARVQEATERAAEQHALLVLALLGHGTTPRSDPRLHFMAKDSRRDTAFGACDVQKLVVDVATHPGLGGAIVLVDTCMAAGGAPGALAAREPPGGARLAMLMGASLLQDGYNLDFSRSLAKLLESGVPGAAEHMTLEDLKPLLEQEIGRQDLSLSHWNSMRGAGALWLARNNAAARTTLGRARADLQEVLAEVFGPAEHVPRRWDLSDIAELTRRLRGAPPSAAVDRALDLVADLTTAVKTEVFLHGWLGAALTSSLLLRGIYALDRGPLPIREVRDATEYVALEHPFGDPDCRGMMARFVVAVGRDAGKDLHGEELQDWAAKVGAQTQLNDAVAEAERLAPRPGGRLRLIVSLHGSITDGWPAEVQAWLQQGGRRLAADVFPCAAQNEAAGGRAVIEAVRWGVRGAKEIGERLRRIEIAAPEAILHSWCPEELEYGPLLGAEYDVVLRWSTRMNPPRELDWINDVARKKLERIDACTESVPLTWLAAEAADDLAGLEDRLRRGVHKDAVGLAHPPPGSTVLRLLFSFGPVVLWPRPDSGMPEPARALVHRYWRRLPAAFHDACRARLRDEPSAVPTNLRAVWDDLEWLDFCDHFTPLQLGQGSAE